MIDFRSLEVSHEPLEGIGFSHHNGRYCIIIDGVYHRLDTENPRLPACWWDPETEETHVLTPEEDGALCRFMEYVERKYGCHDVEQSDV